MKTEAVSTAQVVVYVHTVVYITFPYTVFVECDVAWECSLVLDYCMQKDLIMCDY